MGQGRDENGAFAGPFQKELRRPHPSEEGELPGHEEVAGRSFERPEPRTELETHEVVTRIAEAFRYPLRREELLACAGDEVLKLRHGRSVSVRQALRCIDREVFESAESLAETLRAAVAEAERSDA